MADLEAQTGSQPGPHKTGPGGVSCAGASTPQADGAGDAPDLSEDVAGSDATPLTMQGLATMLAELARSRETEGRVQMYRLQDEYEEKLKAMQVWWAYLVYMLSACKNIV